eukprot:4003569-Pyramimonas_sp.AAC.1
MPFLRPLRPPPHLAPPHPSPLPSPPSPERTGSACFLGVDAVHPSAHDRALSLGVDDAKPVLAIIPVAGCSMALSLSFALLVAASAGTRISSGA